MAKSSYWAQNIPGEKVERFINHSLCYGVYEQKAQIGFARIVTDYTTFAYLMDIFIIESYRGQGLAKWLMECIFAHPELQGLRKWMLATRDAHTLYAKYGFKPVENPEKLMEYSPKT